MTIAHVDTAAQQLRSVGTYLMPAAELNRRLCVDRQAWTRFGAHWDDLEPDPYAAELGTRRLRRYGHFLFTTADETAELMPHRAFVQPEDSNPLYVERDRHFKPLTTDFAKDPLLQGLLRLLGRLASTMDHHVRWSAKVTPFRVLASADDEGRPTPEGLHRDGVTLVTSLLIVRRNAVGGESSVFDTNGRRLLAATLDEPGTLLLGDDRRTLHGVSPIRPHNPGLTAQRDVLVVTFAPSASADRPRRR